MTDKTERKRPPPSLENDRSEIDPCPNRRPRRTGARYYPKGGAVWGLEGREPPCRRSRKKGRGCSLLSRQHLIPAARGGACRRSLSPRSKTATGRTPAKTPGTPPISKYQLKSNRPPQKCCRQHQRGGMTGMEPPTSVSETNPYTSNRSKILRLERRGTPGGW